jgi:hypothetical protein
VKFLKALETRIAAALLVVLAFLLVIGQLPANAAAGGQAVMCAPTITGAAEGPRYYGGNGSSYSGTGSQNATPSGNAYALNSSGCTVVATPADIGYFLSQGFTFAGDGGVIVYSVPVTATGTTSYQIGTLPAGAYIKGFFFQNTDATHAVTGGITCGTSSADTSIIASGLAIGTSSVGFQVDSALAKRVFSTTAQQAIWCQAASSWNTPTTVTITIPYGYF